MQFWEIAGARNVVFFNTKSSPRSQGEGLRSGGCEMTILSSDYRRIILGSCSNRLSIGGSASGSFRSNPELQDLVAAAVLGEFPSSKVTLFAPRVGNDVSYVTRINDEIHFGWQAQCLVKLEGDFTCSARWK